MVVKITFEYFFAAYSKLFVKQYYIRGKNGKQEHNFFSTMLFKKYDFSDRGL